VLELANDAELEQARRALRIGHFGFGELSWPAGGRGARNVAGALGRIALWVIATGWLAMALGAISGLVVLCFCLALILVPLTLVTVAAHFASMEGAPGVTLTRRALYVVTLDGVPAGTPYEAITDVCTYDAGFAVTTTRGTLYVPTGELGPEERDHVVALVRSAVQRARGLGPAPPGDPACAEVLAPRGEAHRAWLERIDGVAAQIAGGAAYRGTPLDKGELWDALEDPDSPPRVRAAAARVLARVAPAEARVRIAQVLDGEHDDRARAHIRVALEEDVAEAARQLERLDA
jgi:hypothetical protein